MKSRFLLKLLPVGLIAAVALVMGARSTPRADASVSGLAPSTFVVNAGSPAAFSFMAQPGAGNITITASSSAITFISPSCAGCAVSGNGTSSVTIVPPQGTSPFLVSFTLDVACTAPGIPITVTASQGNSMTAFGTTGNCATSCASVVYGCCLANVVYQNCAISPVQVAVPVSPCGTAYTIGCPVIPQPLVQAPAPQVVAPVQIQQPSITQPSIPTLPRSIAPPNTGDGGCLSSGC